MSRTKLLILSQDSTTCSALGAALSVDHEILFERDPNKAFQLLALQAADVLLVDYVRSDDQSAQQLEELLENSDPGAAPVLVMASDGDRAASLDFVRHGAFDVIRKPPHLFELRLLIRRAVEHRQIAKARPAKTASQCGCDKLIGSSAEMHKVFSLIDRVADLDVNVVIRGESGTGKELVARALHNLSSRFAEPFTAVSIGALPETLVEAELFGHEKGAFTGADRMRAGRLETVGDGTLFLDEVGEMSPHTQMKLLRVLQERQFTRVGGTKTLELRARVVFATHRDLEEMVKVGEFREDLYYRMDVVRMHIPPLRDRIADIPILAEAFLARYAPMYKSPAQSLSSNAIRLLCRHGWPGNVRELENVVQEIVIHAESEKVDADVVAQVLRGDSKPSSPTAPEMMLSGLSFEQQVRDFKTRVIEQALVGAKGNKTEASETLGITRAYLHRILKQSREEEEVTDDIAHRPFHVA